MIKRLLIILICLGVIISCLGLTVSSLSYDNLKYNVESLDFTSELLQKDLLTLTVLTYALDATIVNFGGDVSGDISQYPDGFYYLRFIYDTVSGEQRVQKLKLTDDYDSSVELAKAVTLPSRAIIDLSDSISFLEHTTSFDNEFQLEDILNFLLLFWDSIVFIVAILYLPVGLVWIVIYFLVDSLLLLLGLLLALGRFIGIA